MTVRAGPIFVRLALLIGVIFLGFAVLQAPARDAETHAALWLAHFLAPGRLLAAKGPSVIVAPIAGAPFRAIVTPSCSSLASVLAIGCLATLAPDYARRRKMTAAGAAIGAVVLGNIVRIAASLDVGLLAGRSSLILFHDSVGNIFSFGYTLGGYILMLWLMLPSDAPMPLQVSHVRA
jgi:exosortase/archaeosortase family protein